MPSFYRRHFFKNRQLQIDFDNSLTIIFLRIHILKQEVSGMKILVNK